MKKAIQIFVLFLLAAVLTTCKSQKYIVENGTECFEKQ